MLDRFFSRAGDQVLIVLGDAVEQSIEQKSERLGTEHLLLGLARKQNTIAAAALASMKIDAGNTQIEVNQYLRLKELEDTEAKGQGIKYRAAILHRVLPKSNAGQFELVFSDRAVEALLRAEEYCHYFGADTIDPAHLLLAILDLRQAGATKVFEELSTNLTFLRRQVMRLMAKEASILAPTLSFQSAVIEGLKELVNKHDGSLTMVTTLAKKTGSLGGYLPSRANVLHMVCTAYLGDILYTQVSFRRHLLEQSLSLLSEHSGPLDKETSAQVVACGAQNIRAEARAALEYLWSHKFRLIHQMFDEAEHDLIGSLIEDLWWAQSEEMALDQSFADALDDHRRTQVLSMQKRKIEIATRLTKLKGRLEDTLRQCFQKRSMSA